MSTTMIFPPAPREAWSIEDFPAPEGLQATPGNCSPYVPNTLPKEIVPRIMMTVVEESYLYVVKGDITKEDML